MERKEIRARLLFYMKKVLKFGQRKRAAIVKVIWYWLIIKVGVQDELIFKAQRYINYIEAV